MDSFLEKVLNDCGSPDDFLGLTLLGPGPPPPPAEPLDSQTVASAEPDSSTDVEAILQSMGWEDFKSLLIETAEGLSGDITSVCTDNPPDSPGEPCEPTPEPDSFLSVSRKRKHDSDDSDPKKPYVKKPLNAFMIFRAEQRLKIMEDLGITNSSAVNTVVGERWRSLSAEEQAPYFQEAHRVRKEHEAMHPGWSAKDNFGKKAKRRKREHSAETHGSTMTMWPNAPGHVHLAPSHQPQPAPVYYEPAYGPAYGPAYYGPAAWQTAHV